MLSLDSQRDMLTEWAEAEEWTVVALYSDAGASGTSVDKWPQFRQMVAGGEAGEFDALLVTGLPELLAEHYSVELSRKTVAAPRSRCDGARLSAARRCEMRLPATAPNARERRAVGRDRGDERRREAGRRVRHLPMTDRGPQGTRA